MDKLIDEFYKASTDKEKISSTFNLFVSRGFFLQTENGGRKFAYSNTEKSIYFTMYPLSYKLTGLIKGRQKVIIGPRSIVKFLDSFGEKHSLDERITSLEEKVDKLIQLIKEGN